METGGERWLVPCTFSEEVATEELVLHHLLSRLDLLSRLQSEKERHTRQSNRETSRPAVSRTRQAGLREQKWCEQLMQERRRQGKAGSSLHDLHSQRNARAP